jgi:hypothetical protein
VHKPGKPEPKRIWACPEIPNHKSQIPNKNDKTGNYTISCLGFGAWDFPERGAAFLSLKS